MHIPSHSTPLSVDTLWHTNWGFAVRQIIDNCPYNYFFDGRIVGSHRDYAEQFIPLWQRREHEYRPRDSTGTPSPLLPGTTAFIRAQITSTLDCIPLDAVSAAEVVSALWEERIISARWESQSSLREQRDDILVWIQSVIDGRIPTILALPRIIGNCAGLTRDK